MTYPIGEERTFTGPTEDEVGNPIVSWEWDFGDGAAGTGQVVAHTYDEAGTYTIHLSTVNSCDEPSNPEDPICFQSITIGEPEPSKNFYIIMGVILAAAIISIIAMFKK